MSHKQKQTHQFKTKQTPEWEFLNATSKQHKNQRCGYEQMWKIFKFEFPAIFFTVYNLI